LALSGCLGPFSFDSLLSSSTAPFCSNRLGWRDFPGPKHPLGPLQFLVRLRAHLFLNFPVMSPLSLFLDFSVCIPIKGDPLADCAASSLFTPGRYRACRSHFRFSLARRWLVSPFPLLRKFSPDSLLSQSTAPYLILALSTFLFLVFLSWTAYLLRFSALVGCSPPPPYCPPLPSVTTFS